MRGFALFAPATILSGALLIGPEAVARGGFGGFGGFGGLPASGHVSGFGGFRAGGGLHFGAARPGRAAGGTLHGPAIRAPVLAGGARVGLGLHGGFPTRDVAAGARFGRGFRAPLAGPGPWAASWGFPWGWSMGWRGSGWWAASWAFPWVWPDYAGACYQWVYQRSGNPYCAVPDTGQL